MVEAVSSQSPDPPFGVGVLPRRPERRPDLGEPESGDSVLEVVAINLVVVTKQEAARQLERTRLDHLLGSPFGRRMACDVEMEDPSPFHAQHEEHVDDVEGDGGNDREVDGQGLVEMVVQEGSPALSRPRWDVALGHISLDGALANGDAEFEQLAVNARRAPADVRVGHLDDELADVLVDAGSADSSFSTLPSPEQLETFSVPANDGLGLDHDECISPPDPEARQQRPQSSVERSEARSLSTMFEAGELMAKGDILGNEVSPIFEDGDDDRDDQRELERHGDDGNLGFSEAGNG